MNNQIVAEKIVEMLDLKFIKRAGWSEPRAVTAWGTKTRKGVINSILRIMEDNEKLPEIAAYIEGGILQNVLIVEDGKPRNQWKPFPDVTRIDFDVDGADTNEICTGCKYSADPHYESCGVSKNGRLEA